MYSEDNTLSSLSITLVVWDCRSFIFSHWLCAGHANCSADKLQFEPELPPHWLRHWISFPSWASCTKLTVLLLRTFPSDIGLSRAHRSLLVLRFIVRFQFRESQAKRAGAIRTLRIELIWRNRISKRSQRRMKCVRTANVCAAAVAVAAASKVA